MSALSVSIVGASGYSGNELLRLLARHPRIRVDRLFAATSAGRRCDEVYPAMAGVADGIYEPVDDAIETGSDLTFLALPSGHALELLPKLASKRRRVVDLGGDFRLKDPELYGRYYGREHTAIDMLDAIPYGLPEWNRQSIASAPIVANPGCYPTSILLPLIPLLRDGLIEPIDITASSLSGVSGAGRSASVDLSFAEMHGNVRAYRVGAHQHTPEIASVLEAQSGRTVSLTFVPHLAPIARGIYSTITTRPVPGVTEDAIAASYRAAYDDAPFVRWSAERLPELAAVVHTNFVDIGFRFDPASGRLVLLSTLDNLIKGAAGQAIQNMNIMFGFPETEGLM